MAATAKGEEWITQANAAKVLRVTERTLLRLVNEGNLSRLQLGNRKDSHPVWPKNWI